MYVRFLTLLAALVVLILPVIPAHAQVASPASPRVADPDIPNRVFRLQVRDSAHVDGDIVRIQVKDRTNPTNSRVLAERIRLEGEYGSAVEFSLAQPVDATIVITVMQDSDNPEFRGLSGVSMILRVEDALGGLVWENEYEQFSHSVTISLNLDTWPFHDRIRSRDRLEAALKETPSAVRDAVKQGMKDPTVAAALAFLGDPSYGYDGTRPGGWGSGTWKCNLFVHDVLRAAGVAAPVGPPDENGRAWPLQAGSLGTSSQKIEALPVNTGEPKPGDIVALAFVNPGPGASGHSGIVVAVVPEHAGRPRLILVAQAGTSGVVITPIELSFPRRRQNPPPIFRTPSMSR